MVHPCVGGSVQATVDSAEGKTKRFNVGSENLEEFTFCDMKRKRLEAQPVG